MDDERGMWLNEFVLGAAARTSRDKEVKEESFVINPTTGKKYYVLQQIGESKHFRVYQCVLPEEEGKKVVSFLKFAIEPDDNHLLETEALVLTRLRQTADKIDQERPKGTKPFNYGYFFPNLEDSFFSVKQGNRQINIISFPDPIDSPSQMTQLSSLISKEKLFVDPRTSVWILGKTLKMLGLAHNMDISNGQIVGSNLLIEREQHGVILFDWTFSQIFDDRIPIGVCRQEVVRAVKMVIKAMGGDPETGSLDSDGVDGQYLVIINKLLKGDFADANQAHEYFYQEVEKIWPREYWPFTTVQIEE